MPDFKKRQDIETLIGRWRKAMLQSLGSVEIVEELESHLRESIDRKVQKGIDPFAALEESQMELGPPEKLSPQFALTAKPTPWLPNRVFASLWILGMIAGLLILGPLVFGPKIQREVADLGANQALGLWLRFHVLSLLAGFWTVLALGGLAAWFLLARQLQSFLPGQLMSVNLWLTRGNLLAACFLGTGMVAGMVWSSMAWGTFWNHDIKEYACLISTLSSFAVFLLGVILPGKESRLGAATIFNVIMALWCYLGPNLLNSGLHSYGTSSLPISMGIATILLALTGGLGFLPPRSMARFRNRETLA